MSMTPAAALKGTIVVDGTTNGNIVLASTTGFVIGAFAYLNGTALTTLQVKIVDIRPGGVIALRAVPDNTGFPFTPGRSAPNYGRSDVSAFTVAAGSTITQPSQIVFGDGSGIPAMVQPDQVAALLAATAAAAGGGGGAGGSGGPALVLIDSTTTPLGGNATYTTAGLESAVNYKQLVGTCFADQAGTLYIEQSNDGTNWDYSFPTSVLASTGVGFNVARVGLYARIRYVNGAAAQGTFRTVLNGSVI